MTNEQLADSVMRLTQQVSAHDEKIKSAHKRIDENDRITEGIHKIAANVEALTLQVKMNTESVNANLKSLEESQRKHGERIGALENKPGKRWEAIVGQIIGLVIAAIVGVVLSKLL